MGNSDIYTLFNDDDIVENRKQTVTTGIFTSGTGSLTAFYTSSAQAALSSSRYYLHVYNSIDSSSVQFDIGYGNYNGFVSASETYDNTYNPAKATYYQYKNILLPSTSTKFSFAGGVTGSNDIFVINFKRDRFKEKLDKGNWELHLTGDAGTISLIDESNETNPTTPSVQANSGEAYYVVSGSGTTMVSTATANPYGIVYPDMGIIILNANQVSHSIGLDYSSSAANTSVVIDNFFSTIENGAYFAARSEEVVESVSYFVRAKNSKYNFSNNPTWQTGSDGLMKYWETMGNNPITYFTTVGLYDNNNNLVAVAKTSKPVKKSFDTEALIRVRLDF